MAPAKKATPTNGKEAAKPAPAVKEEQALIVLKAKALSTNVGPAVIAGLAKTYEDEEQAQAMLAEVKQKNYDLLAQTTEAIIKLAKNDSQVDLSAAFGNDKKASNKLNDQIGLALGFREYEDVKGKKRIIFAKAVQKYFPSPDDEKGTTAAKRKQTLRSNFIHMVKKCAQAADSILQKDIKATIDKKSGTLKLSGPAIKKEFGQETVLLNEKLTVGEGDNAVQLNKRPSFQAVANIGAAKHGAAVSGGSNTRGAKVQTNPDEAIETVCSSLVSMIAKIKTPTERQLKALKSVYNAMDASDWSEAVLGGSEE